MCLTIIVRDVASTLPFAGATSSMATRSSVKSFHLSQDSFPGMGDDNSYPVMGNLGHTTTILKLNSGNCTVDSTSTN